MKKLKEHLSDVAHSWEYPHMYSRLWTIIMLFFPLTCPMCKEMCTRTWLKGCEHDGTQCSFCNMHGKSK